MGVNDIQFHDKADEIFILELLSSITKCFLNVAI